LKLHGYFRSGAAYRVRIALGLKGLRAESVPHHLRRGEQRDPDYLALNPQGLVPTLELECGGVLTQSLAIIAYLDEAHPEPPLLPADPLVRARVRAFALAIACDIHPLQNQRVLDRVRRLAGEDAALEWASAVIVDGLAACERLISHEPGPFCFGAQPGLADICLVPQLVNARRYNVDVSPFTRLLDVEAATRAVPAFRDAAPECQPDAE
jgi:maleylpyruvate isomerase